VSLERFVALARCDIIIMPLPNRSRIVVVVKDRMLAGVRSGSITDIRAVGKVISQSVAFATKDVFEALKTQVEESRVPKLSSLQRSTAIIRGTNTFTDPVIECARETIVTITSLYNHIAGECCADGSLEALSLLWKGAFKWMQFLHSICVDQSFTQPKFNTILTDRLTHALVIFGREVHEHVARTPGVVKLATKLWLRDIEQPQFAREVGATMMSVVIEEGRKRDLDEIWNAVGRSTACRDLILRHIEMATSSLPHSIHHVLCLMLLLQAFVLPVKPSGLHPFRLSLTTHRVLGVLTKALVHATSLHIPVDMRFARAISAGFTIIFILV